MESPKSPTLVGLPMTRVKIIMKSSPDVENISSDALFAMTKATELFVSHLSGEAFSKGNSTSIEYNNLAEVVNNDDMFGFLQEVIPHKITVRDFLKMNMSAPRSSEEEEEEENSKKETLSS